MNTAVLITLLLVSLLVITGPALAETTKIQNTFPSGKDYTDKAFLVTGGGPKNLSYPGLFTGKTPLLNQTSRLNPAPAQFTNRTKTATVRFGTGTSQQGGVKIFSKSFSYQSGTR